MYVSVLQIGICNYDCGWVGFFSLVVVVWEDLMLFEVYIFVSDGK